MNDRSPRRTNSGSIPLRDILPEVMSQIIDRAREAGHPAPAFVIERFDHPKPPMQAPPSSR
ncbi:MAG: hypothetical protein WC654_04985 [Patescibacteria group bacterium]